MKIDALWMSSISDECERTLRLADDFLNERENDGALRHQIDDWKATLQNFGLEYARLESEPEPNKNAVGV